MRKLFSGRSLGLFALIVALFIAPAAPAGADKGASRAATVAAEDSAEVCKLTRYGYQGNTICGFSTAQIKHNNGTYEYFLVGTNYAIYHIWPGSGGWKSLGGKAYPVPPNGVYASGYTIRTIGTDKKYYCRTWPWTAGWRRC